MASTRTVDSIREAAYEKLCRELGEDRLKQDEVLAPYTSFKIGGPADLYYESHTADELHDAVRLARKLDLNFFLLGWGANILIGDRGFRGLVIRNVSDHYEVDEESHRLWVESGATMFPDIIEVAVSRGMSGLEHYVGIPSTVGGALWQNLHFLSPPPERERTMFIAEVLAEAEILSEENERKTVDNDYFQFDYDYSILHDRDDVVLSATFQLEPGDEERMREIMEANLEWREARHPPLDTEPSAGSIFQKIEGVGAGRLIDGCDMLGMRIGGAEITHRHANIIINREDATAADVQALIQLVQRTVEDETGYLLHPEISFVGEFDEPSTSEPYQVEKPEGIVTAAERAKQRQEKQEA